MPYVKQENRTVLDNQIEEMVLSIKENATRYVNVHITDAELSNEEFLSIVGDINYTFTKVLCKLMGRISYGKIAMITGVLENIKQEFYRRASSPYEDKKIAENGDIREYKLLN